MRWARISASERRRILSFLRRNANPYVRKLYHEFMEKQKCGS